MTDGVSSWHDELTRPQALREQIRQMRTDGLTDHTLDDVLAFYFDKLLPGLARKIGAPQAEVRKRIRAIQVTERDDVNSFVVPENGEDRFRIFVNFGLLHFQYKMFKLYVAHFGIGDRGRIVESPRLPGDYIAEAASRLLNAYWNGTIRTVRTIDILELTDFQIQLLLFMIMTAEKYTLAHELGHIAIKLSRSPLDEFRWGRAIAEKAVKEAVRARRDVVEDLGNELAADLIALALVLSTRDEERTGVFFSMLLGACETVFLTREMLHHFKSDDPTKEVPGYPPARFRIDSLRAIIRTDPKIQASHFQMGDVLCDLTQNILFRAKRLSAVQGSPENQYWLSKAYELGRGVESDNAQALLWLTRAAGAGYPRAQFSLGDRYYWGTGVPEDHAEAAKWYQMAAEQGEPFAQFNLGNAFRRGDGVPQNQYAAVPLYRKAAEYGIPYAQANLACCLRDGFGVSRDRVEAYKWFDIAQSSGLVDVSESLQALRRSMSSAEVEEAQRKASEWRTNRWPERV